ncbi:MAG: response regulator [Alphaproteobacteria bacterium]|nr:response regulator [Alphaproteobacteria bacterium]
MVDMVFEAIDRLTESFAIFGEDERLVYANAAAHRTFGQFYRCLAEGHTYREAFTEAVHREMPGIGETDANAMAGDILERLGSGESMVTPTDGRLLVSRVHALNGGFVSLSMDVTEKIEQERELRRAKRRAEEASRSKSEFLANMSHEIRTPLNGMLGMAQLLQSPSAPERHAENVALILESGRALVTLLNDVLDLSKIEAGHLEIVPADVDVADVFGPLEKLWQSTAEDKGLDFSISLSATLPRRLRFDAGRVKQCVSNLVSNALKFTDRGEVGVRVSMPATDPEAGLLTIRVADSGVGMDEATIARLFAPFTQADASISRRFGGTGLGLSISRRLARMMGGDVTVTSRPGEGSTFTLTIRAEPAASGPAARAAAHAAPGKPGALRVLVVDDVPLNRKVARLFLESAGHAATEAQDGADALALLAQGPFDVVLLDIQMPGMDGLETLRRIRASGESWSSVPAIALTANAMVGHRETYLAAGMQGYLAKPLDQRDMLGELARVVDGVRRAA